MLFKKKFEKIEQELEDAMETSNSSDKKILTLIKKQKGVSDDTLDIISKLIDDVSALQLKVGIIVETSQHKVAIRNEVKRLTDKKTEDTD